jgi:NDP-sugar pyrophosphorylase family protein
MTWNKLDVKHLVISPSTINSTSLPDLNYTRDTIDLENRIFPSLCSTGKFFVYKTENQWSSIKSAGSTIYANRVYLDLYKHHHPERLATNGPGKPKIIGDVFIHPTASVDPTAVVKMIETCMRLSALHFEIRRKFASKFLTIQVFR